MKMSQMLPLRCRCQRVLPRLMPKQKCAVSWWWEGELYMGGWAWPRLLRLRLIGCDAELRGADSSLSNHPSFSILPHYHTKRKTFSSVATITAVWSTTQLHDTKSFTHRLDEFTDACGPCLTYPCHFKIPLIPHNNGRGTMDFHHCQLGKVIKKLVC